MPKHHDTAFKDIFSHPEFVQQLLENFTPDDIGKQLDYSTLTVHPGHYITPLFDEKIEDLVWSVKLVPDSPRESETTVYLFLLLEFQSTVDATMPLRMLHYVAAFYHQLVKQKKLHLGKDTLPPVFPFVLYNGEAKWTPPLDMQGITQPVPPMLRPYQPQLRYYLLDEKRLADDSLAEIDAPLSGLFSVEKCQDHHAMEAAIKQLLAKTYHHPDRQRIERALVIWLKRHLRHTGFNTTIEDNSRLEDVPDMLNFEQERRQWKQEGIQEGMQQGIRRGREETALRLLALGLLDDKQVAKVAGLPLDRVQQLKSHE